MIERGARAAEIYRRDPARGQAQDTRAQDRAGQPLAVSRRAATSSLAFDTYSQD
jgi:hypothetical protein